jgi:hypothetical protein
VASPAPQTFSASPAFQTCYGLGAGGGFFSR